jgi:L-fucose isomerase-like protein
MKRRDFLASTGMAGSMLLVPGALYSGLHAMPIRTGELFDIPRPLDLQVHVKPLFGIRIPKELHEGPCRPNDPTGWDRDAEKEKAKQAFDSWRSSTVSQLKPFTLILEPEYVEYTGDHLIDEGTWNRILAQDAEADVYLINNYRIPGLGYKTDKPIIMVGNACSTLDVAAGLGSQGKEVYGALDMEQAMEYIRAIKVRKALAATRMLVISDGEWDYEYNTVRSNLDREIMRKKFGFDALYLPIATMMDEFEEVKEDKIFRKEADRITSQLIQDAEHNTMTEEAVRDSVFYYLTVKKLMQEHKCNAFSATCQEFCVSRLAMKHKVTPCLTHSLLKDEGYAAGCEADLNVTFSIALQIYLAERAPYMGNTLIHDREKNQVSIHHDVPARKMMGYEQADLPYRLVSFTERNWGATLRYDFSRDRGMPVTFCRMTPRLDKMVVVRGEMLDVGGLDQWGCQLKAVIQVSDAMKYFQAARQTGHHYSMVYGDYLRKMRTTAEVLGMEMEEIS